VTGLGNAGNQDGGGYGDLGGGRKRCGMKASNGTVGAPSAGGESRCIHHGMVISTQSRSKKRGRQDRLQAGLCFVGVVGGVVGFCLLLGIIVGYEGVLGGGEGRLGGVVGGVWGFLMVVCVVVGGAVCLSWRGGGCGRMYVRGAWGVWGFLRI